MKGDEDNCPYCGEPARFSWNGSSYDDLPDGLLETSYYSCIKCKKTFTIDTEFKMVKKTISKDDQQEESDE